MSKKIGIMQPYFFPYLGYWQLINAVDEYVIYDNIQYTKKGWINRNRFLQNGKDELFSVNLQKASDYLDVKDRYISDVFDRNNLISKLKNSYKKAPFYEEHFPIIQDIIKFEDNNLFNYINNSIKKIHSFFGMESKIIISSSLDIDHSLKGQEKVLAIVKKLNGSNYINAIGGQELYSKESFEEEDLKLF